MCANSLWSVTAKDSRIKSEESIKLLEEARVLDPKRFDYPYELAFAHYLKQDYKGAIKILSKIKDHKDVSDRLYQMMGNSYDMIGKSDKALKTYDEGLKKFPNSGKLYLEKGNVYWGKGEYGSALPHYEKGIEIDPAFPSNYYRATLIYCNTSEEVWGMIYGEIFMNLERNSARTAEIGKLLYDTYKSEIEFTSDTSFTVSFSKNSTIYLSLEDLKDPENLKLSLPFGIAAYEPTLITSLLIETSIDLASLNRVRTNFVKAYFDNGNAESFPNILFDYQNKVMAAGHFESYNYWILMKGDEESFDKWESENTEKWEDFIDWFSENGLEVSDSNKFFKGQY